MAGMPVTEQIVENRIELLLGRIPGLEDVVVEVQVVDGADRHLGIGVRGEKDGADIVEQLPCSPQHLKAGHLGHPLVRHHERQRRAAQLEFLEDLDRLGPTRGHHDAIVLAILTAQITSNCTENRRVVIDGDDDRTVGLDAHRASRRTGSRTRNTVLPGLERTSM